QAEPYAAERVQLLVKGPAVMLVLSALVAVLSWVGIGIGVTIGLVENHAHYYHPYQVWIPLLLLWAGEVVGLLALVGALVAGTRKLLRFESYEIVVAALVLAILPWSPHAVLGIPAAIWSFWVLTRPEVTAAFAANLRRKQRQRGSSVL